VAPRPSLVTSSTRSVDIGELFQSFDTDGDGSIDRGELRQGCDSIGEKLSSDELDALMRLVDEDDGPWGARMCSAEAYGNSLF
jgi:Ca2+-binding EF-hand superfamily protein